MALENHPLRESLSNELHARPFPVFDAPCEVAYLALSSEPEHDLDSANQLFAALGGEGMVNGAAHSYQHFDGYSVRWERHTEFVTFAVFLAGESDTAFDDSAFDIFPKDWLNGLPNTVLTSAKVRMIAPLSQKEAEKQIVTKFYDSFKSESLAISYVLDQNAVIASDFRMDEDGHVRFGVIPIGQVGRHRLGRITQRLLEIETYRAVAMLTLPVARDVFDTLAVLDTDLTRSVEDISASEVSNAHTLDRLMSISARIEHLNATHSYRFGAGKAYTALVDQRITVLREERFLGRQTFAEFMMRRFHPTVRTCKAAEERLLGISARAARAADLLGTRVNVRTTEQNRKLLHQMDKRAETQLRLQETVEGLSVVAISYYGVNLLAYFLLPLATTLKVEKTMLSAGLVLPVTLCVWWFVRRMKRKMSKGA